MVLSKQAILAAIDAEDLVIDPLETESIQAAHIDLHLELPDSQESLVLKPQQFLIAKTKEKITTSSKICAFMEGKASLAKQGISIEQSSTFIEPGSHNTMTLEIFNASADNVTLTNGQKIAKMFVTKVVDEY